MFAMPQSYVDPHPEDADNHVGDQHGREPGDPEEPGEWHLGVQAQRQEQAADDIDDRRHGGPDHRVGHGLPEDWVLGEQDHEVPRPTYSSMPRGLMMWRLL
jgi:hypothetical protein